jgi:hypothetical protein
MGLITSKVIVRELLTKRDFDGIKTWAQTQRSPQRVLFSLALDDDELTAWRAIEAVGRLAGVYAEHDLEKVRDSIRRLLWLMNDESGGLGWRSPELIGEILVNVPSLINEFGRLLSSYFKEEPFERGTWQAVARIASIEQGLFADLAPDVETAVNDKDPLIRYHAVSILLSIDAAKYRPLVTKLMDDRGSVSIYDFETGRLMTTRMGKAVEILMKRSLS